MEKKIVYLKLFQIVLTLTIIWQFISLRQFCGTFADPKAFFCGDCERITLIGKDSKTGEFGIVSYNKWHKQFIINSTNGQQIERQQCQFFDEFIATLPPAGRHCIPITITPFDFFFEWIFEWTGLLYRNPLNNRTLFHFSRLFFCALLSLGFLGHDIMEMRRSMEEYELYVYWYAFASVFCWCVSAVESFKLLFYWTDLWTCVNFRADHTNVPLITLVLSLVLVFLSIFEIVLHEFVLNDVDTENDNMIVHQQQQQPKKNSRSACCAIE